MKIILTITTVVTIILIVLALFVVLGTLPHKIKLDESNNLELKTVLGIKTKIPIDEITIKEMPQGTLNNLIRVFGTQIGDKSYGKFRNTNLKRTFFLFIIKPGELVYFEYNGKEYIVNKWD